MKTILHIVGNRPQFIKLAVLYHELSKDKGLQQKIIHTGQHFSYEMSDIFFKELLLPPPHINFKINSTSSHLFIAEATESLQAYFMQQKEAVVFVYGDTNTTLAAAIAAKRSALPLLHFEAGVRTFDKSMPEEINRIITDRLADVNYCCTSANFSIMQKEGYGTSIPSEVILTGDLMLDAFIKTSSSSKTLTSIKEYVVCTIHREANLSNSSNLISIIDAINSINKDIAVIMPLHPHTKKRMLSYNITPAFSLQPPLGYPDMKNLLSGASYIITDSGGTSREAYFLQKKSLIIMDHPFWPEIIQQHCSISSRANTEMVKENFYKLPSLPANFNTQIFGEGNAAKCIHNHLTSYLPTLQF